MTLEEYLAAERKAEGKSEYFAGEVFAMVGATLRECEEELRSTLEDWLWRGLKLIGRLANEGHVR